MPASFDSPTPSLPPPSPAPGPGPRSLASSVARWLLPAQLVWALVVTLCWTGKVLFAPIDPDYAAGEMYDHVLHWAATGQLYVPLGAAPYRVLNYPPAFLAAVHAVQGLGGDPLLAGRLLGLAAILLSVTVCYAWLAREGCGRRDALGLVAVLASSYPAVYFCGQLHIQWSAVCLTLLGYYLIGGKGAPTRRNWVLALVGGAACALACYVKQSQVVPGLVALAWLGSCERRRLLPFVLGGLAVALPGALWLQLAFGSEVWHQVITFSVGALRLRQLGTQLLHNVAPWLFIALYGAWLGWDRDPSQASPGRSPGARAAYRDLRFFYFAGASLWMLSSARLGAGPQYFIEWCCAAVIWTGPAFVRWLRGLAGAAPPEARPSTKTRVLLAAAVAQLVFADASTAVRLLDDARISDRTVAVLEPLCAALPPSEKLVAVELASVARHCGHQVVLQPFIMTMLSRGGLWDERPFVAELARGAFPVVLLPFDPGGDAVHHDRWSDAMLDAIGARYHVAERYGEWVVLRPTFP